MGLWGSFRISDPREVTQQSTRAGSQQGVFPKQHQSRTQQALHWVRAALGVDCIGFPSSASNPWASKSGWPLRVLIRSFIYQALNLQSVVSQTGLVCMCVCMCMCVCLCDENHIFKPFPISAPHPANYNLLGGVKLTAGSSDGDRRTMNKGFVLSQLQRECSVGRTSM